MISRITFMNTAMTVNKAKNIYNNGPIYVLPFLSQIPNWVYWGILIIIILVIVYSYLA